MERDQRMLDAYARYLLMPLSHEYWRWRDDNNVLRWLVRWENPFSHEMEDAEGQSWDNRGIIVHSGYAVPRRGLGPFRHFTREEFIAKTISDPWFAALVGLT